MRKVIDVDFGSAKYDELVELRYKVLLEPLGLKFLDSFRDNEMTYLHIACVDSLDEKIVGGLMMVPLNDKEIRMMQVAVDEKYQREGVGHQLVEYAVKKAKSAGFSKLVMHAMLSVVSFYEKLGFKPEGDIFDEGGITFVKMVKNI
ncbi:MAG: GNAT family N-acetyltransferase [Alphaproteobacteria bacterium]|nr:GNAT family N-acetyltransferase [Alphaproteobacteria bacterium]